MMRTGRPHLLPIHNPFITLPYSASRRPSQIRPAARLAEQLAPRILARQTPPQELFFLRRRPMRQQRRRRQPPDTGLRHANRANADELLVHDSLQPDRQSLAIPIRRPSRHTPPGIDQDVTPLHQPVIGPPVGFQPGPHLSANRLFCHCPNPPAQTFQARIISSRCQVASPRNTSELFARLNQRCVSLSQVNPIPPWIWIVLIAVCRYASDAAALASDAIAGKSGSSSAAADAAAYAADFASSTSTSISACLCFIDWNDAIDRPNCTRKLA